MEAGKAGNNNPTASSSVTSSPKASKSGASPVRVDEKTVPSSPVRGDDSRLKPVTDRTVTHDDSSKDESASDTIFVESEVINPQQIQTNLDAIKKRFETDKDISLETMVELAKGYRRCPKLLKDEEERKFLVQLYQPLMAAIDKAIINLPDTVNSVLDAFVWNMATENERVPFSLLEQFNLYMNCNRFLEEKRKYNIETGIEHEDEHFLMDALALEIIEQDTDSSVIPQDQAERVRDGVKKYLIELPTYRARRLLPQHQICIGRILATSLWENSITDTQKVGVYHYIAFSFLAMASTMEKKGADEVIDVARQQLQQAHILGLDIKQAVDAQFLYASAHRDQKNFRTMMDHLEVSASLGDTGSGAELLLIRLGIMKRGDIADNPVKGLMLWLSQPQLNTDSCSKPGTFISSFEHLNVDGDGDGELSPEDKLLN